jgi:hypothetical protein
VVADSDLDKDSDNMNYFGTPIDKGCLVEPFGNTFAPAQARFAQLLAFNNSSTSLENRETFEPRGYKTSLKGQVTIYGHVFHAERNMFFIGDSIFKACMAEAKCLKENHNAPALAAFTKAMKKFMYT